MSYGLIIKIFSGCLFMKKINTTNSCRGKNLTAEIAKNAEV